MKARALFAAGAGVLLAACTTGEKIARAPLETNSRFCGGKALYRSGAILFCAEADARFAKRITYSVGGNAAQLFARQLDDVLAVAQCLTGRPFDRVADGALSITIDDKIVPPREPGSSSHGESGTTLNAHLGAARTGSTTVSATNGEPAGIGERLDIGMWSFLDLSEPKAVALLDVAFPEPRTAAAPMREVAGGARACKAKSAMFRTGATVFCAPQDHPWPDSIGYAVIGDVGGLDAAIAASAARASRLTGVRFEQSGKPALLVILSERKLTKETMTALLAAAHVTPPDADAVERLPDSSEQFKKGMTNALAGVVGKPIAGVVADWMTTQSTTSTCCAEPNLTSVIGLHNRDRIDTESAIETKFLDVLGVTPPAYHVPEACAAP